MWVTFYFSVNYIFLCSIYTCYKPNNIVCLESLYIFLCGYNFCVVFIFFINVQNISEHLYIDYIRNARHVFISFQDLILMYIKLLIKHWSF